jgi:hypothetical protein
VRTALFGNGRFLAGKCWREHGEVYIAELCRVKKLALEDCKQRVWFVDIVAAGCIFEQCGMKGFSVCCEQIFRRVGKT